jgi:hypothetical protein
MTDNMTSMLTRSKGWATSNYDDFYNDILKWNSAVALIWLDVETEERVCVVVWAGDQPEDAFVKILDETSEELEGDVTFEGVGVGIGYDRKDLVLENLLQKNKLLFATRITGEYDYYLDVPEFEKSYDKEAEFKAARVDFSDSQLFSRDYENAVNDMKMNGVNKYVLGSINDNGKVFLDEVGVQDFEFVRNRLFDTWTDTPRIMFYNFEYEDKEQTVCLFVCKVMKLSKKQRNVIDALKRSLTRAGVSLYPIIDPNYFDVDILINIGAIPDPDFRIHINNDLIE